MRKGSKRNRVSLLRNCFTISGTGFQPVQAKRSGATLGSRFSRMKQFLCVLCVTAMSPLLMAAGDGETHTEMLAKPEQVFPAMLAAIVLFITLFVVLKKLAWGPILKGLDDRSLKIRTEIESAENARQQAGAALDKYQKELAKARHEAGEMICKAKGDAQRVADDLRAKNDAELTLLKERAMSDIEAAKRAALADLYGQTTSLATAIAGRILEREINEQDHTKLVEDSIRELGTIENQNG